MKKTIVFLLLCLFASMATDLIGQGSKTFKVYVPKKEQKCTKFSIDVGGSKVFISAKINYAQEKCTETEYYKLKTKKIPVGKELILKGKSYYYDGSRVYEINNVTKTCGWPMTEAEFLAMQGFS